MKKTYTLTTIAWLSSAIEPADLIADIERGAPDADIINTLVFNTNEGMDTGLYPWTRVGRAEITVTFADEDQLIANTVQSLRNEQRQVRADAEMKAQNLEVKI